MSIDISTLRSGKRPTPPAIVIYSEHGIGKSTLANGFPSPVFAATENVDNIDADSWECDSWLKVLEVIGWLLSNTHTYRTFVLDSLDWTEILLHKSISDKYQVSNIAAIKWQEGYKFALTNWVKLTQGLDLLRQKKGMAVVLTAHAQVKRCDNPTTDSYDRYCLDLHKEASAYFQEWADCVFFLGMKYFVQKQDVGFGKEVNKAVSAGERVLYTADRPAYQAKNRYELPHEIPVVLPASETYARFEEGYRAWFSKGRVRVVAAPQPVTEPPKPAEPQPQLETQTNGTEPTPEPLTAEPAGEQESHGAN